MSRRDGSPRRFRILVISALLTVAVVGAAAIRHWDRDRWKWRPARTRKPPEAAAIPARDFPSPVRFVDATAECGVRFDQVNGYGADRWYYVENLGSGVVFFDGDGDRDPDLFFANGHVLPEHPADGGPRPRAGYFRNDGTGRFVDATAESGLGDANYSLGASAADYDNAGDLDLYVMHFDAPNALYRNDGSGRFVDVAAEAGVTGRPDATDAACAFADVDRDGWLDLYVAGYSVHSRARHKVCVDHTLQGVEVKRYCNPKEFAALPDQLFRNRGDGTFADASASAGIAGLRGRTLGLAFCDFDDDGDPDLFAACDRSPNHYFVNDGAGVFTEQADLAGVAMASDGYVPAGMGVATGDYDGDGRIDLVVTYFEKESDSLFRNLGDNVFEDRAQAAGTAHVSYYPLGWGTELFDADLDGRLDWLVVNGHVQPLTAQLRPPGSHAGYAQLPLFFLNRGEGLFESLAEEAGTALAAPLTARGLATADIDGDGDLDVAINSTHSPARVWRNDSPRADRHWLRVRTVGAGPGTPGAGGSRSGSNRDGVGARLVAHVGSQKLVREIHTGQSYLSQSDLPAHFGLGAATRVDMLEVRWPSGRTSRLENVPADQLLEVREPD